ncbi:hypothetical protein BGZ94_005047 [Podila epigama]|nr:hypothetical protein BGZ94_005047 [Podila epigama]
MNTNTNTIIDTSNTAASELPPIRNAGPFEVTPDIFLSPFGLSDTDEVYRVLNQSPVISQGLYSANVTFPFPYENALRFTKRHQTKMLEDAIDSLAIRYGGPTGPVIGLLGLHEMDHEDDGLPPCYHDVQVEDSSSVGVDSATVPVKRVPVRCGTFGYWLSPEYTGREIMTQVVSYALKHLCRAGFGYERMHASAWDDNVASCRVMERVGMRPVESYPCFVPKFNLTKTCAHYIIDV